MSLYQVNLMVGLPKNLKNLHKVLFLIREPLQYNEQNIKIKTKTYILLDGKLMCARLCIV